MLAPLHHHLSLPRLPFLPHHRRPSRLRLTTRGQLSQTREVADRLQPPNQDAWQILHQSQCPTNSPNLAQLFLLAKLHVPKPALPSRNPRRGTGSTYTPPPPPKAPPQYAPPKYNAEQLSYLPQLPASDDIPLTKDGIQNELQWAPAQDWTRALANFQVLGSPVILGGLQSQEQRPLWARRIRDISAVPRLFHAITKVKTEKGLNWEKILITRQVLTKEGKVTVATGHEGTYVELSSPTKIHGLVGALCQKMWAHPDFTRFFNIPELTKYENWKLYDMISSTLVAVYNHFCSEAGLTSRMLRRKYPELGVRIVHDAEANIDPNAGLSERHKRALRLGSQANKRSKDATQGGYQNWAAEWSDQEEEDDSWNSWQAGDDWDSWGNWRDQRAHGTKMCQMIVNLRPAPGLGLLPGHVAERQGTASRAGHSPHSSNSQHSACRCCLFAE